MRLPSVPQISNWNLVEEAGFDDRGRTLQRLSFALQDEPDTRNFYALRTLYVENSIDTAQTEFDSRSFFTYWTPRLPEQPPFLSYGYRAIPDTDFDGQSIALSFEASVLDAFVPDSLYEPSYMILIWTSWEESGYRLGEEYGEHRDSQQAVDLEILFSSQAPLPMFSNAEGGYGILGGYTTRQDTIFF